MYTLDELKKQNTEITDLINLLSVIIEHDTLRKNPYVCELVSRFNEKVWMHLVFEDNTIYSELAKHHNPDISAIAKEFHRSAREIKKRFSQYVKMWCQASAGKCDAQEFRVETREIFDMLRERIRYETEEMFPLVCRHFDE